MITQMKISFSDVIRFDYGSYSEIFKAFDKSNNQMVVLKVIRALSGQLIQQLDNSESGSITTFEDIFNEFQISQTLSTLNSSSVDFSTNCFPRVLSKYLVCGQIPQYFCIDNPNVELMQIKNDFHNLNTFPHEYAVIIMTFGGQSLWKVIEDKSINAKQLLSVLRQVIIGLAVAEARFDFEHRDLHDSNIIISETNCDKIHFIHNCKHYYVESRGLKATIIDTTFSRITIDNTVYCKDLTNVMVFTPTTKLSAQDRTYKSMVTLTKKNWSQFCPKTNINWLLFICRRLLKSQIIITSSDQRSGVTINIKIHPNSPDFYLMYDKSIVPKVNIIDTRLYIHRSIVHSQVVLAHNKMLEEDKPALYFITRREVKTCTIPKDSIDYCLNNVESGVLPRSCIYHFLRHIACYLNGQQYPHKPYTPDFQNDKYIREYFSLFEVSNQLSHTTCDITKDEFAEGFSIFAFNFIPDLSDGVAKSGYVSPLQRGGLRIELKFNYPLAEQITALIYCEYDSLIEIQKNRFAVKDFS
ncbi:serine/threonine-protein kinase haspin homolog [Oppia nitens]|uniref:serine/threonine-protein kinase haspin homolog n=1 Tax=Oppia nitens TaxID=1686743 RepID=UPI0023DAB387|nr:serine/threonine-protein kinase haspin homolog [Oppia nitens]